jgi:hypothetical protein
MLSALLIERYLTVQCTEQGLPRTLPGAGILPATGQFYRPASHTNRPTLIPGDLFRGLLPCNICRSPVDFTGSQAGSGPARCLRHRPNLNFHRLGPEAPLPVRGKHWYGTWMTSSRVSSGAADWGVERPGPLTQLWGAEYDKASGFVERRPEVFSQANSIFQGLLIFLALPVLSTRQKCFQRGLHLTFDHF